MINPAISARMLTKSTNYQNFSRISCLIEHDQIINDPRTKSDLLNNHFASKSTVNNPNEEVPLLDPITDITKGDTLNTSTIETARIISLTKKSQFSHCSISGKFLYLISTPIYFFHFQHFLTII